MSQLVVFLALAFSIVIAIFAVQNTTPVAVQFLSFRADTVAVSVLVLISAALGAAAMLLLGIARDVQWRWRQRALGQQLRQLQARIAQFEKVSPEETPAERRPIAPPEAAAPRSLSSPEGTSPGEEAGRVT